MVPNCLLLKLFQQLCKSNKINANFLKIVVYICKPNGRFMSETKNFLLETSFKLFLQKSFKEVTMKEIVNETGLSKGAFYHYFTSKEHLFNEIIDAYYMDFFAVDYSKFNQENLYAFYHEYIHHVEAGFKDLIAEFGYDKKKVAINFYLLVFDAIKLYPGFREKMAKVTDRELRSWANIVSNARMNKEIASPMSDEQIAKVFTMVNDGIGLHSIMEGRTDTMIQDMLDVFDGFYNEIKA